MADQKDSLSEPVNVGEAKLAMTLNPGDNCVDCNNKNRLRNGIESYGLIALKDYGNRLWCRCCLRFQT